MSAPWDPDVIAALLRHLGVSTGQNRSVSTGRTSFDTQLDPTQEQAFQTWRGQNVNPQDPGSDYDFRGAFLANMAPDPQNGHWRDTYKKPNEPTFSDQSVYAKDEPGLVGHWNADQYVGPQSKGTSAAKLRLQNRVDAQKVDPTAYVRALLSRIATAR